jgi:hypothetical protein
MCSISSKIYFQESYNAWVCQSVRNDGNPAILQKNLKFVVRVGTEIPHIAMTICMFYLHARMAKNLPTMLKDILYITDSAVIFVMTRALNHYFFYDFAKRLVQNSHSLFFLLNGEMVFRVRISTRVSQMGE